jgi:hypothetical protein
LLPSPLMCRLATHGVTCQITGKVGCCDMITWEEGPGCDGRKEHKWVGWVASNRRLPQERPMEIFVRTSSASISLIFFVTPIVFTCSVGSD